MATITASSFNTKVITNAPPGVNALYGTFNLTTTTASVGDVILLAKIPRLCKVLDLTEDHTCGSTALALDFGLEAADLGSSSAAGLSAIANALAKGQVNRADQVNRLPLQVNCTATDRSYSILKAKVASGTGTVSLNGRWTLYIQPNNDSTI